MQVFGCSDEQTAANQRAKLKGAFYFFGAVARASLCTAETTVFLLLVSSVVWISETGNEDLRSRNHTKLAKKSPHPLALLATSPASGRGDFVCFAALECRNESPVSIVLEQQWRDVP